jgi:hypothetical protein
MKQLLKALLVLTILASTQANAGGKTYRDNLSRIANERDDMKAKARIALRTERYIQNWNGRRVVQEEAMDNTEMQMKAVRVIVLKNLDRALKHRKKSVWAWTYSAYATANEEYKASMAAQERYLRLLESAGGRLEIDEANNKKSYTLQGEKDRALGKLNIINCLLLLEIIICVSN